MLTKPPNEDIAQLLSSEVSKLKADGHTGVSLDQLANWLARVPPPDERDRNFEWFKVVAPLPTPVCSRRSSRIGGGPNRLKTLITINGGAAAALLAFLSNLLTKSPGPVLQARISAAMAIFVGGVALAGGSTVFRYFAQYAGASAGPASATQKEQGAKRWMMVGHISTGIAILLGLSSLVAFCIGGWQSFSAFR